MSETQSVPAEQTPSWINLLSLEPLSEMSREEELAWYSRYVDSVVPESNIEHVGFHRIEKKMDREAFEKFILSRQEELHREV